MATEFLFLRRRILFRRARLISSILTAILTLSAIVLLFATRRPDVAGVWRVDLPRAGDVTLRTYFLLHQKGKTLDGRVVINGAVDLPVHNARFEGSEAVFDDSWGAHYRVSGRGENRRVKIRHGNKTLETALAFRVSESETEPPAAIPLPAKQPVPPNGLALTPPMGWSSWNYFGEKIDAQTVREIADALVSSGLAAAGYTQVNIDDGWEGDRDADGKLVPNSKFPDMKALADYVHERGLKLGLYSSPGPRTCAGYEGSFGHEEQDAKTFAAWGVDYLKYDWCSAARVYSDAEFQAVYQKMGHALARCGRPIVYSVCQYGLSDVWKWAPEVGANLWRTTHDIRDTWQSVSEIGFNQSQFAGFAAPGRWNDPDMLVVGNGGMTLTEYRSHFSLWCLLAAPLIAGNDIRHMSAETRAILGNREAIAVDQDHLGRQGERIASRDGIELWTKPLQDGGLAIGLFNRNEVEREGSFTWQEVGRTETPKKIRDLWLHQDVAPSSTGFTSVIPAHGVVFLRVR